MTDRILWNRRPQGRDPGDIGNESINPLIVRSLAREVLHVRNNVIPDLQEELASANGHIRDLTDRLRRYADYADRINPTNTALVYSAELRQAADALDAAEARLDAIDALHYLDPHPRLDRSDRPYCVICDHTWPCPTRRILHPEDGE